MPITINYTPLHAVAELATRAGEAESQQQIEAMHQRTAEMAMQHDLAMREAEFHAQTQADAQYREQHFQRALKGDEFQNHRLTLQEQMGMNIEMDRQKAQIDQQIKLQGYQQKAQEFAAFQKKVKEDPTTNDEQKQRFEAIWLSTHGESEAAKIMSPTERWSYQTVTDPQTGTAMRMAVEPTSGRMVPIGAAAKVSTPVTDEKISKGIEGAQNSLMIMQMVGPKAGYEKQYYDAINWQAQEIAHKKQELEEMRTGKSAPSSSPTGQSDAAPDPKLSAKWPKLTEEQKGKINTLLANGVPIEKILTAKELQ